jgi:hypothetical protein
VRECCCACPCAISLDTSIYLPLSLSRYHSTLAVSLSMITQLSTLNTQHHRLTLSNITQHSTLSSPLALSLSLHLSLSPSLSISLSLHLSLAISLFLVLFLSRYIYLSPSILYRKKSMSLHSSHQNIHCDTQIQMCKGAPHHHHHLYPCMAWTCMHTPQTCSHTMDWLPTRAKCLLACIRETIDVGGKSEKIKSMSAV